MDETSKDLHLRSGRSAAEARQPESDGIDRLSGAQAGGLPDAERGKHLFEKRCGGCHLLDHEQTGPRLGTVYGRKAGSTATFRYSEALRSARIAWDDVLLDKRLIDKDALIPGNEMDFSVQKAEERAAIIRFLQLSSERQASRE